MKKTLFIGMLIPLLVGLPGCSWMKKETKAKIKKTSKKVAALAKGNGVPLARYTPGDTRFWSNEVEAFVLEGVNEEDQRYAPKASGSQSRQVANKEWKEQKSEKAQFEPVYFAYDSYGIPRDQEAVMQYDVAQAKAIVKGGKVVRVEGHSDRKCISQTYNMAVSQKRANTVSQRLARAGVPAENIKAVGYGDSRVAVDVAGKERRNRRVEFTPLVS